MMAKINVVLRACDVVVAVNKSPRPFHLDKRSLIKICFKSLMASLNNIPHTITIIGDKLSDELIDFFERYKVNLILGTYGNDESIKVSIKKALEFPDDEWVYLCEDDYLHKPEAFAEISTLIEERNNICIGRKRKLFSSKLKFTYPNMVIFPPDYPDRYKVTTKDRSYIFHSSTHHWRQVANITFTFMMEVKTLKKHLNLFEKSSKGARDGYLSDRLFGRKYFLRNKCICLSPLPGLSTHMHSDTLTPLTDWSKLVEIYQ